MCNVKYESSHCSLCNVHCTRLLRNVYMSLRWWRVISTRTHMKSWKRESDWRWKKVLQREGVWWKSDTCEGIIVWNMRLRLHKCIDYFHLYMLGYGMYMAQSQSIGIGFFSLLRFKDFSNSLKFNASALPIRPYYWRCLLWLKVKKCAPYK